MAPKLIVCLFIFASVYSVFSAQWQTKPYQHSDYPDQCYDTETDKAVPVGEVNYNMKQCLWMQCQPDLSFFVTSCAPTGSRTGCKEIKPDLSKPYPNCCPQLICE